MVLRKELGNEVQFAVFPNDLAIRTINDRYKDN